MCTPLSVMIPATPLSVVTPATPLSFVIPAGGEAEEPGSESHGTCGGSPIPARPLAVRDDDGGAGSRDTDRTAPWIPET